MGKHPILQKTLYFFCALFAFWACVAKKSSSSIFSTASLDESFATCASPDANLQAVLNAGSNLTLCPGKTYLIAASLQIQNDGQVISTPAATRPSDYATLQLTNAAISTLIVNSAKNNTVIEKVILDGGRLQLGAHPSNTPGFDAAIEISGSNKQIVRNTVIKNTRGWSALHVSENGGNCTNSTVENNIIMWSGADSRGNGSLSSDPANLWADGISMGCKTSSVLNNLVLDATDGAIVIFGAPGTQVQNNTLVSLSRETWGGINLVDTMDVYAISGSVANKNIITNYQGSTVQGNTVQALGSRFHIGYPVGPAIWFGSDWISSRNNGVAIINNTTDGDAFGYGFALNGAEQVSVTGNASTATHSGLGDGTSGAAAYPAPFLYNPATSINSPNIQSDFITSSNLNSLLRHGRCPSDSKGYSHCAYTLPEAYAIVRYAYIEILGREPDTSGASYYAGKLLQDSTYSADAMRTEIMAGDEFKLRFGSVPPANMQSFKQTAWQSAIFRAVEQSMPNSGTWPASKDFFNAALNAMRSRAIGGQATNAYVPPSYVPPSFTPVVMQWYLGYTGVNPDAGGLAYYTGRLNNGEDCRTVAHDFAANLNYQGPNGQQLNNFDYVVRLFRAYLGREPDSDGQTSWTNNLNQGASRDSVTSGFLTSPEFSARCAGLPKTYSSFVVSTPTTVPTTVPTSASAPTPVQTNSIPPFSEFVMQWYLGYTGVNPDAGGLAYYTGRLNNGEDCRTVAHDFAANLNYQGPNGQQLNNYDYVVRLYRAYLGREPDSDGQTSWTNNLNQGASRDSVTTEFLAAKEFGNRCVR